MAYSRKPLICKIDDLPRVLKMILAHQLLYATKPRDDEWSKTKWSWSGALFRAHRTPDPPSSYTSSSTFSWGKQSSLHDSNGRWSSRKCREFYWLPRRVFDSLQASILPLSYKLNESSCDRVGRAVGENIRRFKRKMDSITPRRSR